MSTSAFALDENQLRALLSNEARLAIKAPPGSGKTRVLAARCARLIEEGTRPEAILAITFTIRAARELKERITVATGVDESRINAYTFHALALKVVKAANPSITLAGRSAQMRIIEKLGAKDAESALRRISSCKSGHDSNEPEYFKAYCEELKKSGSLDFDDLVPEALRLMEEGRDRLISRIFPFGIAHLMADEYQDTNMAQAIFLRAIAKDASLLVIGDPDQSIYSFRGADPAIFSSFVDDHPGAKVETLDVNYRSGESIVKASNAIIANSAQRIGAECKSFRPGAEVRVMECVDEPNEGAFIAREIERLMGGFTLSGAKESDLRFSDFAVLCRTNKMAEALRKSFERSSLPFEILSSRSSTMHEFVDKLRGVKALPDKTLREAVLDEAIAFGLSTAVARVYADFADKDLPFGEDALKNLCDELLLVRPEDAFDVKTDRVSIMTMHSAKGLEWKVVIIAGLYDGLVPFMPERQDCLLDEERRLFYVGMTRAKDRLYLTYPASIRLYGEAKATRRSRFLDDLPTGLAQEVRQDKPPKRRPVQKGLFD